MFLYEQEKGLEGCITNLSTLGMVGGKDAKGGGIRNFFLFSFSSIYIHYFTSCTMHMPFYNFLKGFNIENYKKEKRIRSLLWSR